jgi:uncharacterized flavoprotein (TIGR03862 family)
MRRNVAIVGSGPAALMAADVLSERGHRVTLFEKRKGTGRKLLVAGSSGLNVSNTLPFEEFIRHYSGPQDFWRRMISGFTPEQWIRFIEELGIGTFEGTSGRWFIEDMKASRFLQAWNQRLISRGVELRMEHECVDFESLSHGKVLLRFAGGSEHEFDAACLCLGGGSWEPGEVPLRWPGIFRRKGIGFTEFTPSNVGFQVAWSEAFLKESEGKPLKGIVLSSPRGSRKGDAMITRYGMEGTPVYFAGTRGTVWLDLKPDLTLAQVVSRLSSVRENLSPIRRAKKRLSLGEAALSLLFHSTPKDILSDPDLARFGAHLKHLPLEFGEPQPLSEAISSAGGVQLDELDPGLMLTKQPGIHLAGEMLDWDVPTGGFLIQACVAQGRAAALAIAAGSGRPWAR